MSCDYRGVTFHKVHNRWQAKIAVRGESHHLGYFDTAEEAARAYDVMARRVHGDKAKVNFDEDGTLGHGRGARELHPGVDG